MKGVNKLILEIRNPDSEYFERAILFVKSEKMYAAQSEINRNAEMLLKTITEERRKSVVPIIILIAAAVTMLTLTVIFLLMS